MHVMRQRQAHHHFLGCSQVICWTLGAIGIGAGMYPMLQAARRNGWCKFVDASPRAFHESLLGLRRSSTPDLPQLATAAPRYPSRQLWAQVLFSYALTTQSIALNTAQVSGEESWLQKVLPGQPAHQGHGRNVPAWAQCQWGSQTSGH